ncbi:hypothetical protein Pla22_33370 [Rubripirellula amarantea]|uniref:VWFA domain-containing protein n=2 Tax=Rubripirellula amarantea TaxID=2527999 RepID=A0A5C5WIE8_9BACT|nr:hypothetical protein Pla22_33370 [Rubripirellula amarantea]
MDFLLQSYRKQKKWIRLRQLLLLLSRIAVAALLVAMLCGWTGGGRALQMLGGTTTHHVVILDDSYSMGDSSFASTPMVDNTGLAATAYGRSLGALQDLTRRLVADEGNHQLTVMRASRAAMTVRAGSESGDTAADLSAQTISGDGKLINRVMSTSVSPIRTDIGAALDLASELISSTPADTTYLYIASDFRERDWGSAERLAASLRKMPAGVAIRMIDCAATPSANLAVTDLTPVQDVWVAGVPVVVNATVKNFSASPAKNVPLQTRVIRYGDDVIGVDATRKYSGTVESLPTMMIESLPPGGQVTKSFQVFITQTGTHAVEVSLPEDSLKIDNTRSCTLPLTDAEKVLIVSNESGGDLQGRSAYHVASVLNPGSQVRIGAVPDVKPPSFLRSATWETLAAYRAIYLVDLPEINRNTAEALQRYVQRGGGLAMFLGSEVSATSYNESLLGDQRTLLPGLLTEIVPVGNDGAVKNKADLQLGEASQTLLSPLQSAGEAAFALVGLTQSWDLDLEAELDADPNAGTNLENSAEATADEESNVSASAGTRGTSNSGNKGPIRRVLDRADGLPFVIQHDVGRGRVVTVLAGLDGQWTNWPGDPTFVVFLLQTNAMLWSGASPPTGRYVDEPLTRVVSVRQYTGDAAYVPPTDEPPRVSIDINAVETQSEGASEPTLRFEIAPEEMVIEGESNVDDWLRPGISEWSLIRSDGSTEVSPTVGVIRIGESDLKRASSAEISQSLLPTEVKFVSSDAWSDENQVAGSSTLMLFLLGLLGLMLAAEQALAYWASYHSKPAVASSPTVSTRGSAL